MAIKIDGKKISADIKEELKEQVMKDMQYGIDFFMN